VSSLRARLGKQLKTRTGEVIDPEDNSLVYRFSGLPSVKVAMESIGNPKNKDIAAMWNIQFAPKDDDGNRILPIPEIFNANSVGEILTVLAYIQPDPLEAPYTEVEIAEIYATEPGLFILLFGKASQLMSMPGIGTVEIAAGNSTAVAPAAN